MSSRSCIGFRNLKTRPSCVQRRTTNSRERVNTAYAEGEYFWVPILDVPWLEMLLPCRRILGGPITMGSARWRAHPTRFQWKKKPWRSPTRWYVVVARQSSEQQMTLFVFIQGDGSTGLFWLTTGTMQTLMTPTREYQRQTKGGTWMTTSPLLTAR